MSDSILKSNIETSNFIFFSVSVINVDKLCRYARAALIADYVCLATAESATVLRENEIECLLVDEYVGMNNQHDFPPTMHPSIEGLLTSTDKFRHGIVFDMPYDVSSGYDVGGHTLLAFAVKGNNTPVMTYEDMDKVCDSLASDGCVSNVLKQSLQEKALINITNFYATILRHKNSEYSIQILKKMYALRHGENPYQINAYIMKSVLDDSNTFSIASSILKHSDEKPCYTNIVDIERILISLLMLASAFNKKHQALPYIAIAAKHGNVCGLAVDWEDPSVAVEKALWGNPKAIWGGEVVTNFCITSDIAQQLLSSGAQDILSRRKNRVLVQNQKLTLAHEIKVSRSFRSLFGEYVEQGPCDYVIKEEDIVSCSCEPFSLEDDILIAWCVAYTTFYGGNEVAISKNSQLIGIGGGASTIEATKIAIWKSEENMHKVKDSFFAADAFFPFTDVPEILIKAECQGGLVPAGGKNENKVQQFFSDAGLKVGFIRDIYRGFCRH